MNAHAHHLTRSQVIELLEERDTLREQVRQLEAAIVPCCPLPAHWKLTLMQERYLLAIRAASPNVLHRERAMIAVYGLWDDAPDQKTIDVYLSYIRKKLRTAESGIEIETVWGRGWRMSPEIARRFDAAVAEARSTAAAWPAAAEVA